jgi:2-haloacid dehalogenase
MAFSRSLARLRRGLARLNHRFETCTLTNANVSLLEDVCRHGSLPFRHLASAEEVGAYKPSLRVYHGAASKLGLEPSECPLVAADLGDLWAAQACGFQTIYVERGPQEESFTVDETAQAKAEGWVDM